jgi:hypothetical protein
MHSTPVRPLLALASLLALCLSAPLARAHGLGVDEMTEAAKAWLASLSPELKAKATFPLTSTERETWFFVPIARKGITFEEMTEPQRKLAHNLLKEGLSQAGYDKATAIMALENVLIELNDAVATRNPLKYYVTVFGTPGDAAPWGWRVEGHHVSINFTIVDDDHVHVTPSFLGSNPAEVRSGAKLGLRVLGNEEDLGRALVTSFTEEQRKTAILPGAAPREIITSNKAKVDPLSPAGLAASAMTPAQRKQLEALVTVYARRFRLELADDELNKISADGWDQVTFAWAGGLVKGQQHYYRIQGPSFLIEFDNSQGNGNHIHSVWRDFAGDFGRDLLKEHYEKDHATASPAPAVK